MKLEDIETTLYGTYEALLKSWESLHLASLNTSDGQGAQRVVKELMKLEYESIDGL